MLTFTLHGKVKKKIVPVCSNAVLWQAKKKVFRVRCIHFAMLRFFFFFFSPWEDLLSEKACPSAVLPITTIVAYGGIFVTYIIRRVVILRCKASGLGGLGIFFCAPYRGCFFKYRTAVGTHTIFFER